MPKIISSEESGKYDKKVAVRTTLVRSMLLQMQPGQEIMVTKEEWKWKRVGPNRPCSNLERKSTLKFECYRVLNASGGWIIKRIE